MVETMNDKLQQILVDIGNILKGSYNEDIDKAIYEWNELRNDLKWDKNLEYIMLKEEIDEFFSAKSLTDMIDAERDTVFVLSGTFAKAFKNNKYDELEEILDKLDIINVLIKMHRKLTQEWNNIANRSDMFIPESLLKEAMEVIIKANNQKGVKKNKDGKVEKPKDFKSPEEEIYKLIKDYKYKLEGSDEK